MRQETGQHEQPPWTHPEAGCLECDWPCARCDYNLRGLPPDGNCPECGHAIAPALREEAADPTLRSYVNTVRFVLSAYQVLGSLLLALAVLLGSIAVAGSADTTCAGCGRTENARSAARRWKRCCVRDAKREHGSTTL